MGFYFCFLVNSLFIFGSAGSLFPRVSVLLSLVNGRDYSSLWCAGFSLLWLLLFRSMDSRHTVVVGSRAQAELLVYCCTGLVGACGIFPDQGLNLCLLY